MTSDWNIYEVELKKKKSAIEEQRGGVAMKPRTGPENAVLASFLSCLPIATDPRDKRKAVEHRWGTLSWSSDAEVHRR